MKNIMDRITLETKILIEKRKKIEEMLWKSEDFDGCDRQVTLQVIGLEKKKMEMLS